MSEAAILLRHDSKCSDGVHLMPFAIAYDGSASVEDYFNPSAAESENSVPHATAHFRGRCLKGVTRQLPEGYQGLVLKPCGATATAGSDAEQRSWQTSQTFKQLHVWNHDLVPTATDWHSRCIDWLALADKIHTPVLMAQVEQELQAMQQQQ